jgi:hypothetical protein
MDSPRENRERKTALDLLRLPLTLQHEIAGAWRNLA